MSSLKRSNTLNQKKKKKLLTSFLTRNSFSKIEARIYSNSMYPLLKSGMKAIIDSKKPKRGDIVCYYSSKIQEIIAHRVLTFDLDTGSYFVKGDNRRIVEIVKEKEIIGRINAIYSKNNSKKSFDDKLLKILNYLFWFYSYLSVMFPVLPSYMPGSRFLVRFVIK